MDVKKFYNKNTIKTDVSAGLVVFLVAVPLCLGIALASGAPLFSGIIAGIIGGIVVTLFSRSPLGVSGPAAGLAVMVFNAIESLGSYENLLLAVVIAGAIQILLGIFKSGIIAYYFPSSVIHGMLAGIGSIIVLKQLPHTVGFDAEPEGSESFQTHIKGSENTFLELAHMFDYMDVWVLGIALFSLLIMLTWETQWIKKQTWSTVISGPLLVVLSGIGLVLGLETFLGVQIASDHMVNMPVSGDFKGFISQFTLPNFSAITQTKIWTTAAVLAVIASIETLLSVEAADKLDPHKRVTPTNRELIAQGIGNMSSGLIGGLPITQVIVRSSTNVQSGGQTRLASFTHGLLLLVSAIVIPRYLNMIPLASLAIILLMVGYKLAKPSLFKKMYAKGWEQFFPFTVTVIGIIFTDLLTGILIGMAVAVFYILYTNFKTPYFFYQQKDGVYHIDLSEQLTFLNKAGILTSLYEIPTQSKVVIDATRTVSIDADIVEILENFKVHAAENKIQLTLLGVNKFLDK